MDFVHYILAVIAFIAWVPSTLEMLVGFALLPRLKRTSPLSDEACPTLSIIVPACEEESTLEPAMRSLLALDYPGLEIIAINDRSTDATGEILDRIAASHPRLRVVHLTELPPGWLGKNHALHVGAALASGEWLLFTDADVEYQPEAMRRALAVTVAARCDHMVALPAMVMHGFWERAFVSFFIVMFNFRFRVWQAAWKRGWGYVGIGAFNLIRANVYREMGGHEPLRMEVADDIQLGWWVRRRGYRQCLAEAEGLVRVRWIVGGLPGAVIGLAKNAFSGVGYSWILTALTGVALGAGSVWPMVGAWVGPPAARWLCLAALLSMPAACWTVRRVVPVTSLITLAWPACAVIFWAIIVRSGVLAERQGGIRWRGTFYALSDLRQGRREAAQGVRLRPRNP